MLLGGQNDNQVCKLTLQVVDIPHEFWGSDGYEGTPGVITCPSEQKIEQKIQIIKTRQTYLNFCIWSMVSGRGLLTVSGRNKTKIDVRTVRLPITMKGKNS